MRKIVILGSTGSIGLNALQVVREHPGEFRVAALAAHSNAEDLLAQAEEFRPEAVCLADPAAVPRIAGRLPSGTRLLAGPEGLAEIARLDSADIVLAASSGSSSLVPVLGAIEAGKRIALANKEILVMAGPVVTRAAEDAGVELVPIDSEHSAIFQCLAASGPGGLHRILLTGSGGPLRDVPSSLFKGMSKETVTRHPRWNMGKKISVDSATLMNKGLEIIEARWLFGVEPERIKVVIHPEAIVHSMVEFVDGSIIAQLGVTDMKSPILYALAFPDRLPAPSRRIDLAEIGSLTFAEPDLGKFPCLGLALEAARQSETTLPCVLNAADEVAVNAFLNDRIDFTDIPRIVESVMAAHRPAANPALDDILSADLWAREESLRLCGGKEKETAAC